MIAACPSLERCSRRLPVGVRILFLIVAGLTAPGIRPASAAIRLPAHPEDCISWAADNLNGALGDTGVSSAAADVVVVVPRSSKVPPGSFDLSIKASRVTVTGSDAAGAMYGLFELAEQIRQGGAGGSWPAVLATVAPTNQQPYVEFRGDNAFIPASDQRLSLDVGMWKSYIDMLAGNRYNVLDLHGGYNYRTTGFPNLYPLLVHVPAYPSVGDPAVQDKNLDDFRQIVTHARRRGMQVAFMNYNARVPGVPTDKLADYTARAVSALLNAVPDLHILGFRIGESGQPATFYQDAYLRGLRDSGRTNVRLYTRSWGASRNQLDQIGKASSGQFDIEIKYNGEHLGLPYHAIHGGYKDYSYQDYIRSGAPYRIIWQVRANGTHRFWPWADTAFIRRTVRTFPFGNARGFTLEPPIAYFSPYARDYYTSPADQAVYNYTWQKWWMWYLAWGRMSYNPALPETTLIKAYLAHFGGGGDAVYRAMQASGPIVPLAFSYRFPGPDQRDFSPETETGAFNYHQSSEKVADVLSFAHNRPMDVQSFVGINTAVSEQIQGKPEGRIEPSEVADLFADAAAATRAAVDGVNIGTRPEADEWRLLKADLLASSFLGDYYGDRIRALVHLDYALKTGSRADGDLALAGLNRSRADWQKLADVTGLYAPLSNNLRHQPAFRWLDELAPLETLDASVPALLAAIPTPPAPPAPWAPMPRAAGTVLTDVTRESSAPGSITIRCSAAADAGVDRVILRSSPLPSESKWQSQVMESGPAGYTLTIPVPDVGLLYSFEIVDRTGRARVLPSALDRTPYYVIPPQDQPVLRRPG